jgi:hypothetical protein
MFASKARKLAVLNHVFRILDEARSLEDVKSIRIVGQLLVFGRIL